VVTVHDLVPFLFPGTMTRWSLLYARATHRRILMAADRIICDSADTANDVVTILGVAHDRVRVVPLGVDSHFFETPSPGDLPSEPYILFVGTQELRKNLERLESAVEILRGRGFPHMLVVAGAGTWGSVHLTRPFVRRLGGVTENELRRLYADAACLALPSLHEGFGLPALEAMAAAARTEDRAALVKSAFEFHISLVALAGHKRLEDGYRALWLQMHLFMAVDTRVREQLNETLEENVARHRRLLALVEAGDREAVMTELDSHGDRAFFEEMTKGIEDGSVPS
jgi:hypothetical protein